MGARDSGDPVAVAQASGQVIALALAEMAKLQLDKKAYADAIRLCQESLEFEDTASTRVEIAIASLYAKKFSEAVKQATSATELDPQNPLAWTVKGEALLRSRDFAAALSALGKALDIKVDAESMYALGTAQLGMDDKEAATKSFSRFLALVGDSGWSSVLVGRAYQEKGLAHEAQGHYQKALFLNPATPNAHYFWAMNSLQANAWAPNTDVYSHLQAELQLNPRHFEANYMLGSLASTARNYEESDRYLHLAAQLKPSVPETWVLLGLNAQSRKANKPAEVFFRKAIRLAKNLAPQEHFEIRKAYFGLGRLLIASGRAREGAELLNRARELQAQSLAEGQKRLAAVNGRGEGKDEGGAVAYVPESDSDQRPLRFPPLARNPTTAKDSSSGKPEITRSPSDPEGKAERHLSVILGASLNDLATAEAFQQKYQEAFNHYREAAQWDPKIPGLQRNLGLASFFAGRPEEAIRLLYKEVTVTPGDAHARAVLGLAYFATHDFAKAARTIAPIANKAAEDPQLGFAWAKSLAETGRKPAAVRALQRLDAPNANLSVENLVQFGKLWQQLGESDRAAETFRRALVIDPENPEAKCALQLAKCP